MPRLSDSMEEGTLVRWIVADGAVVRVGDELVEIETDKATMTYEADAAGVVHILASAGDTMAVGTPIAQVGDPTAGAAVSVPSANGTTRTKASPLARRMAGELGVVLTEITGTGPQGRIVRAALNAPSHLPLPLIPSRRPPQLRSPRSSSSPSRPCRSPPPGPNASS